MELDASRIAVLDVNHGGLVLARELLALGYEAFAVDIYRTGRAGKADVRVLLQEEALDFDLVVAPVHVAPCPILAEAATRQVPVLTHHRMAGLILEATGRLKTMTSVEVTGTYGKTTTCALLTKILDAAGTSALTHASTGLTCEGEPVGPRLSITPANLIEALDRAREAGYRPTTAVFEVSLGGCGTADVGVITTLDRDYPIAGGTKRSSAAKMQMVKYAKPGCTIVHEASDGIGRCPGEITLGDGGDCFYDAAGLIDGKLLSAPLSLKMAPALDRDAYAGPVLCATAIALRLGVAPEAIVAALAGFAGVRGRMMSGDLAGRTLLDNSCSGLTLDGVRRAVEKSRAHPGRRVLVLGEERYNVCEGLDVQAAAAFAGTAGVDRVITVGDRLRGAGPDHVPDLHAGIEAALRATEPGDMIISCVKTWR